MKFDDQITVKTNHKIKADFKHRLDIQKKHMQEILTDFMHNYVKYKMEPYELKCLLEEFNDR